MNTAIIADVHGNWPALQAVLADCDRQECSEVVSLGDVAGYYSQVNECADELIKRGVINVMGNHDYYIVSDSRCPRSSAANACLDYQRRIIADRAMEYLRTSLPAWRKSSVHGVHGGWRDPLDEYMVDVNDDYFAGRGAALYFSGHTHIQRLVHLTTCTYCNPGSVGQPRDNDPRASYAVLKGDSILLRRVSYDIDATVHAMAAAGFDAYYTQGLCTGTRIGGVPR